MTATDASTAGDGSGDELVEFPHPYQPDWDALKEALGEGPFMTASVELLKEAVTIALLAVGISRVSPYDLHEAIRCALLLRIAKLGRTMLRDTCTGDGDQQMALSRQLIESAATLLYLMDDSDGSRHTAFVQDSLIAEREVLVDIASRQRRDGDAWPIEGRMTRSIERTARAGGVDLSRLPSRRVLGWPSAEERVKLLGPTAYVAYRMGSGALHGSWHDLYRNHLAEVAEGFVPRFDVPTLRPQPLLMAGVLIADGTRALVNDRAGEQAAVFGPHLADLLGRLARVDGMHERQLRTG